MRILTAVLCAFLPALIIGRPNAGGSCADLSKLTLPNVKVTMAESVEAPPAFCRVAATLTPTSDSDIRMEVWLPATGWRAYHGDGTVAGNHLNHVHLSVQ